MTYLKSYCILIKKRKYLLVLYVGIINRMIIPRYKISLHVILCAGKSNITAAYKRNIRYYEISK